MVNPARMRILAILLASLSLGALTAPAAQAATFGFSETFDFGVGEDGFSAPLTVTGTFDGTANGDRITNLSNFTLFFNGVAVGATSLFATAFDGAAAYNTDAVLSISGRQNNLYLTDTGDPATTKPSLYLSSFTALGPSFVDNAGNGSISGYNGEETATILRITELATVPEPASIALLGFGVAALLATPRLRSGQTRH